MCHNFSCAIREEYGDRRVRNYCKEFIKAQVSDRVVLSTMTNSYIETIKAGYIEADDDI